MLDNPPGSKGMHNDIQKGDPKLDLVFGVVSCDNSTLQKESGIGAIRVTRIHEWAMEVMGKVGGMTSLCFALFV